ncbi:hypothetical protein HN784_01430 [bacterium]|nr:hypothetical protein [bacterium]MBT7037353.1 hypothetical protein [bacterium]MBT7431489.1 hypothetical protein [bacterium]
MKKMIHPTSLAFIVLSFLFLTSHFALAGTYSSAADGGGLNNPLLISDSITAFFEEVMLHLQGIIAFLAVMFIVIGAILYMTAGGSQAMATAGKVCVTSAIIGLVLAGAGPSFLYQIKFSVYGDVNAAVPTDIAAAPTLIAIIGRVLTFLLSITGILGIIGLTISGLLYLLASGDSSQAQKAKEAVKYSLGGIAIAGAALIIVRQIILLLT